MKFTHTYRGGLVVLTILCSLGLSGIVRSDSPVAPDAVEINNLMIENSLTGTPGDPAEGRSIFADRKLGNCLACHANSDLSEQLFHGEVGPALDGVAGRWSEGQLRTIVVNAKATFTDATVMPGFYSLDVGENVREELIGKTILTAQQVEDVVALIRANKKLW